MSNLLITFADEYETWTVESLKSSKSQLVTATVKEHPIAKKMGDFFIDVAKLIFGGVILAGLMKQEIDYVVLVL